MMALALSASNGTSSVVDVGTDHGILAVELALTNAFRSVVGVDISSAALSNALLLQSRVESYCMNNGLDKTGPRVDLRIGNGLHGLARNDADIVCIAGVGVNTMKTILEPIDKDALGVQHLVLQPTSCKPGNLMKLYESLHQDGFKVWGEEIDRISQRFYITLVATRNQGHSVETVPGEFLISHCEQRALFLQYLDHHRSWIEQDIGANAEETRDGAVKWMQQIDSILETDESSY